MSESPALVPLVFVTALLYSSVGHGGASGYLAAMSLAGAAPAVMRPAALLLNILVSTTAAVRFGRAGHFSWPLFWPFAAASVPCALIGGYVTLPIVFYKRLLGVVLVYAAYRLFRGSSPQAEREARRPPVPVALALGGAIGLLSGLTGVGGGIFLSPIVLLAGWATTTRTAALSAAFILVNSIAGLSGNLAAVRTLPVDVFVWAGAALAGGVLGAGWGSRRLGPPVLRRTLAAVLLVASMKLLLL